MGETSSTNCSLIVDHITTRETIQNWLGKIVTGVAITGSFSALNSNMTPTTSSHATNASAVRKTVLARQSVARIVYVAHDKHVQFQVPTDTSWCTLSCVISISSARCPYRHALVYSFWKASIYQDRPKVAVY